MTTDLMHKDFIEATISALLSDAEFLRQAAGILKVEHVDNQLCRFAVESILRSYKDNGTAPSRAGLLNDLINAMAKDNRAITDDQQRKLAIRPAEEFVERVFQPVDNLEDVKSGFLKLIRKQEITAELSEALTVLGRGGDPDETVIEIQRMASRYATAITNGPKITTAGELLMIELPPQRWAVEGIIPEGATLLAGKPKLGKSWMVLAIAIAVASGGKAFGTIAVESGDVLYLALEDTNRRLQERIAKLASDGTGLDKLHLTTAWPRFGQGGKEQLDNWLQSHPGTRLIVVDTLERVRPSRAKNANPYAEDYAAMSGLKELADKHRVSVVVVHHVKKGKEEDVFDTILGTQGLAGGGDGAIVLRRMQGQADGVLHVRGRDVQEREFAIKWDPKACAWSIMGDADEFKKSRERTEILRVLREAGRPMTPKDVADVLGKPAANVKVLIWKMAKAGDLKGTGDGEYVLL